MNYVIHYSTQNHPKRTKWYNYSFIFFDNLADFILQQFKLALMQLVASTIKGFTALNGYGFKQRNYLSDISHTMEDERLNEDILINS